MDLLYSDYSLPMVMRTKNVGHCSRFSMVVLENELLEQSGWKLSIPGKMNMVPLS